MSSDGDYTACGLVRHDHLPARAVGCGDCNPPPAPQPAFTWEQEARIRQIAREVANALIDGASERARRSTLGRR